MITAVNRPFIWLNDRLVVQDEAHISATDRGFLLADGVFETVRVAHGGPCHLMAHLRRLQDGCAVLNLPLPAVVCRAIGEAVQATIAANGIDHGSVRLTWTRGSGPRGLLPSGGEQPTLLITASALAPSAGMPWRLVTCQRTRRNEHSPLSRIKSLNYGDGLIARQEAAARGAEDAILLNSVGRVVETSIANLFIRREGFWSTPRVSEGALPGIRRAHALAEGLASEDVITIDDLAQAEAAVVTSALMVQAVGWIDGRPLPAQAEGERWAANLAVSE
jgi:branched-chain amino acid aminotransferase